MRACVQRRGAEHAEKPAPTLRNLRASKSAVLLNLFRSDVISVLHGFAHVDVAAAAEAEVKSFAGFAVGWKPILAVDLFAIGYECGDEIFWLVPFG